MFSDHKAMKLEINHKKNTVKHTEAWKLNNMLLKNEWVNNEIKEKTKRYLEINKSKNKTTQNLCSTVKAVLRREFILLPDYFKKQEKSEINNLTLHLKELEKEQHTKKSPK